MLPVALQSAGISATIKESSARLLGDAKNMLNNYSQLVKHLSPQTVLKRGYALVYHDGRIVTDAKNLRQGSGITTVMATGEIHSTITSVNKKR